MLGGFEVFMITIDIETRSDKDISKCGVYAYTDTPYFEILLFAYSVDGQPVQVVDTANNEEIPENILAALADENVVKRAFNCNFERVCLSKYLRENDPQYFQSYSISEDTVGDYLSPESWHCSMIHARTLGLPSSLAEVGKVLRIEQQKMTEGKALIKFFCTPYDTIDGVPQFHNPKDYPDKWEIFKAYNKRDVEAELEIDRKLSRFPVPDFIWQEFYLDQEINDRGILVDMQLANKAISLDAEAKEELTAEMKRLTGVENPNSVYQLLDWLETQGYKSDSLVKAQVQELIKTAKEPVKSVLQLRLQLSKSSVKKYTAMKNTACSDNRARGMFSFYGASRTGRFCIAEGTLVLIKDETGNIYEKPIESVLLTDLVFDGEIWVQHEGVVFSGEKTVIEWDGIIATPEHQVFINEHTKISLSEAKEMKIPLWKGKNI